MAHYDVGIIDGNNMFYKSWAVHRDFSTQVGDDLIFTGGAWGLIKSLITFKKNYIKDGKLIVCWDRGHDRRTLLYPAYKGNRSAMEEEEHKNFKAQMKMAQDLLADLGIAQAFKQGEEADDIVGTLSKARRDRGLKVLIMSADKDFQQLIDENVDLLAHKGNNNITLWTDQSWEEDKGIHPSYFSVVLGLMGDSGDNIPGVQGIGEKGAYRLLSEYRDIVFGILNKLPIEHLIPEKKPAVLQKLIDNQEVFRLSHELAVIDKAVKGVRIRSGKKDMDKIEEIFEMYQFTDLLKGHNWKTLEVI